MIYFNSSTTWYRFFLKIIIFQSCRGTVSNHLPHQITFLSPNRNELNAFFARFGLQDYQNGNHNIFNILMPVMIYWFISKAFFLWFENIMLCLRNIKFLFQNPILFLGGTTTQSDAVGCNQRQSDAIRGSRMQSEAVGYN